MRRVVDVLAAREEQFLPPHLDHVVDALTDAAAVNALETAPNPRQTRKLVRRVRRPHVVAAFEIREAVVGEVMADFPQAVGRQRRQECNSADPFVQRLVRRVGAVAGVVTDDEQPRDPQRRHQRGEHLAPTTIDDQQARDRDAEHQPIEQEPHDRCCNAAFAPRTAASSFWNLKRDLSGGGALGRFGSDVKGVRIRDSGGTRRD